MLQKVKTNTRLDHWKRENIKRAKKFSRADDEGGIMGGGKDTHQGGKKM